MDKSLKLSHQLLLYYQQNNIYPTAQVIFQLSKRIEYYTRILKNIAPLDKARAFRRILVIVDNIINDLPTTVRSRIQCRKGCHHCCHYDVGILEGEASLIIEHCETENIPIDKAYLLEQVKIPPGKIARHPTHSACVFLKDGLCSIYKVRPIACRQYFVVTEPKYCNSQLFPPSTSVGGIFFEEIEYLISALFTMDCKMGRMPAQLLKHL